LQDQIRVKSSPPPSSFSEFKSDFSLSAKRASELAFKQLQTELNNAPEFRR